MHHVFTLIAFLLATTISTAVAEQYEFLPQNVNVIHTSDSPIEGFNTLHLDNGELLHIHESGYFFTGDAYHTKQSTSQVTNYSETQRRNFRAQALMLPIETIDYGDGPHVVWVFTDPTCGYCRQLHSNMASMVQKGIQIRYMGFPRSGTDSDTFASLTHVWCNANPHRALDAQKRDSNNTPTVVAEGCRDTLLEHYSLAKQFGVRGTPAIFTKSGAQIGGYLEPDALVQAILRNTTQ